MNRKIKFSLFGIIMVVVFGTMIVATNAGTKSILNSIFIGDDDEANHTQEAVISTEEAKIIAENHTGGTAISVELENENGYLVYGVIVDTDSGSFDVKIDAGNGEILQVELDDAETVSETE